jgi:peptidoglycan hydrolase CwlO-like protein
VSEEAKTEPPKTHRSTGWIITCVVLLIVAVGLGAWALSAQSSANDKQDQLDAQAQQTSDLQKQLDQIEQDVSNAVSTAGDNAEAAKEQLQGLGDDLKTKVDELKAKIQDAAGNASSSDDGDAAQP